MALERELKYKIVGSILIIKFIGEINFFLHDEYEKLLEDNAGKYKNLIIDMTKVTYINSTGVNILFSISKHADIRIIGPKSKFICSVFRALKLDKVMGVYGSLNEAIDSIIDYSEKGASGDSNPSG